jgi:hypothetical protein
MSTGTGTGTGTATGTGSARRPSSLRRCGIVAEVLATVLLGPSAAVAAALDEANAAPPHTWGAWSASVGTVADLPRARSTGSAAPRRAVPA